MLYHSAMKKLFTILIAIMILTLISCNGGISSPGGETSGSDGLGTKLDLNQFTELYGDMATANKGVSRLDMSFSQQIAPEFMAEYDAAYEAIREEWSNTLNELSSLRETGEITDVEYYERQYEANRVMGEKQMRLEMEWENSNVWDDISVITRLSNSTGRTITIRLLLWTGNPYVGEGVIFSSQAVDLPPHSDDVYSLEIATGGKHINNYYWGTEIL